MTPRQKTMVDGRCPSTPPSPTPAEGGGAAARSAGFRAVASSVLLIAAGVAAYSNSFATPFLFDDVLWIVENPYVRRLWPLWNALIATPLPSMTVRPLVNLQYREALRYAPHLTEAQRNLDGALYRLTQP